MNKVAIFCVSYSRDFRKLKVMASSLRTNNVDKLPLIVAVPRSEIESMESDLLSLIDIVAAQEDLIQDCTPPAPVNGFSWGYLQQQMVKLNAHKLEAAENYFIADSDTVFIRPFTIRDFIQFLPDPLLKFSSSLIDRNCKLSSFSGKIFYKFINALMHHRRHGLI